MSKSTNLSFLVFFFLFMLSDNFRGQDLLITGGWRFNSEEKIMEPNDTLFIRNGVFETYDSKVQYEHIRLSSQDYILPGFIDLHAHYRIGYKGKVWDDTIAMPKLFLANGITTTFPAGEIEPEKMRDLSLAIENNNRTGARILNSGPYFGSAAPDWNPEFTAEDIRNRVDQWANSGVKGFKAKNITAEHLSVLIERAHHHDLTVTGHLNSGTGNSVNPQEAIDLGIDRIEHFLGGKLVADTAHAYFSLQHLDPKDPGLEEIIQHFIKNEVYFDATLATFGAIGFADGPVFENWANEQQFLTPESRSVIGKVDTSYFNKMSTKIYPVKAGILKRFYEAGGLITVGTDRPLLFENFLGYGLGGFFIHRELDAMVEAGIPEKEVLFFATLQNARAIKIANNAGSLKQGKWGDAVIIEGNPLENIRNTRNIKMVIKSGEVYKPDLLLESVKGKLGPE